MENKDIIKNLKDIIGNLEDINYDELIEKEGLINRILESGSYDEIREIGEMIDKALEKAEDRLFKVTQKNKILSNTISNLEEEIEKLDKLLGEFE